MSFFLSLAGILFLYMTMWFFVALIQKRNDVADVAWGLGFVLLAFVSLLLGDAWDVRSFTVLTLVTVWGTRLAWHIANRHKGKEEDFRYAEWRRTWKWFFLRSYFQIYILQGVLLLLVISPVLLINYTSGGPMNIVDFIGILIWCTGFYFESRGDAELKQFLQNPKNAGNLIQEGLWKYTRHPNYFGEVTQWWGIFIIALSTPFGLFGIIGPITITVLILKVSGVPLLEAKMSKHPQFAEYKRRTNMFFPWFRKV